MNRSVLPAVVLVFLGALLWQQRAVAQTVHYVDNIRTCDGLTPCYTTIMDAVNAAAGGDFIEVFASVYHETVAFSSKGNIVLKAHVPALKPVIAAPSGNAIEITASPTVQVLNFVIEAPNGRGVSIGGPVSSGYVIQGNRIKAGGDGIASLGAPGGTVRDNAFLGNGISGDLNSSLIEGNTFIDAGISLFEGGERADDNVVRRNVLRGGGISLTGAGNTIKSNFVSGGTGISLLHAFSNVIRNNTSIENGGCDINDTLGGGNTWRNNRFGTKCGDATE